MVQIPERGDPTIDALNAELVKEQSPYVSENIGFGEIGNECSRYLYLKINSTEPEIFDSDTLRRFRNGHADEAAMAADLRKIPGIELYTHDPNRGNKQYKVDALSGRFTGRLDGVIVGLRQSPESPHVWEHKSIEDKEFEKLLKLKAKYDEKEVLAEWKPVYYSQAQSNMYHVPLDRHYMTISTPGLRRITTIRTELKKDFAAALVVKAEKIINAKEPPEKIGGPDFYVCKFCRFYDKCHGNS